MAETQLSGLVQFRVSETVLHLARTRRGNPTSFEDSGSRPNQKALGGHRGPPSPKSAFIRVIRG
jgi:hypothetical protein